MKRAWPAGLPAVAAVTLLVLAWAMAGLGAWWADLSDAERATAAALLVPRAGLAFLLVLALPLLLWAVVGRALSRWPRAARRLREQVAIVTAAHAAHRVDVEGAPEMRELARAVDDLAQAHARLQLDLEQRVAQAQTALSDETRRLAALMSELTMGVLVCNRDGRILLYNGRAVALLAGSAGSIGKDGHTGHLDESGAMPVGLGRALDSLLDPRALEHAWRQLRLRFERGGAMRAAQFVTARPRRGGPLLPLTDDGPEALLHAQMVPTLDAAGELGGYVLLIDDVTRSLHERGAREALLLRLTEGQRGMLANLRAALQTLQRYPAIEPTRRERLVAVAHDETERLVAQLADATGGAGAADSWSMEDVQAADLGHALQHVLRVEQGIDCAFDEAAAERWLTVDSHAIVRLLAELAQRLVAEAGAHGLGLELREEAGSTRLDLCWSGAALPPGRLDEWERFDAARTLPATLLRPPDVPMRQVLDRHGAELWPQVDEGAADRHRLCLQLGARCRASAGARDGARAVPTTGTAGRPIAYDFDLFNQAGQSPQLDATPLTRLSFTVFDTETTGLRPSEGDEIIALGAVRIVNGRLLEHERFDRLVRPRREVRASATAVHGISTLGLADEPPLEQVLPGFARFCQGTVLVAHNAAFDMRFLELAQARTGERFEQPVLDTLLLSALLHPGHRADEHHLEQIAARLGVPVVGRHQALGDALTAARVFLKLLPLLAGRGIVTLGQAREASQRLAGADGVF